MSLFNEKLKNISIKEFLVLIIGLYLIWYFFNSYIHPVSSNFVYLAAVFYFLWKLRGSSSELTDEIASVFSVISFKYILLIVLTNVLFSYGMLYLSDFLIKIPLFYRIITYSPFMSLFGMGSIFAVVIISPIFEELVFRGLFLNKLKIIVPTIFAVLISSLLFASLHTYGSMISAFVFAVCMAILYLKTENIFVPIFAHFLNNLIAETITHLDTSEILFTNNLVITAVSILAIISFAVILISIFNELKNFK